MWCRRMIFVTSCIWIGFGFRLIYLLVGLKCLLYIKTFWYEGLVWSISSVQNLWGALRWIECCFKILQLQILVTKKILYISQNPIFHCLADDRPSWSHIRHWINPLNPELNPICYLLALLVHHFLHVSRIRVESLTLRLLMSYIYIYIWSANSWCF